MTDSKAAGRRARGFALVANALLAAASVTLVLGLFEVGLRLAGHRAIYEVYSKPSIFWQHDPLLGWSHQPGARDAYVGPRPWPIEFDTEIEINALGLRGPEIPAPAPDELRVLFLGDSMVAAFEVPYAVTFEARVERALNQRLEPPVRVINAGVRGYGSDESFLYYRERGRKLRPDVVVLYHSRNDPVDNLTVHEMRRPFGKAALALAADGSLELVGHPVPSYPMCSEYQLSSSFEVVRRDTGISRWSCRAQMLLFDHSALFSFLTISVPWRGSFLTKLYYIGNPHFDHVTTGTVKSGEGFAGRLGMAIVTQLGREVTRDGGELLVMGRTMDLEPLDLAVLEREGIGIVLLERVAEAPPLEVRWKHDAHYNPEGHRIVAEEILPGIERRLRARLKD